MLKDYPVKFNGEAIITPKTWNEASDVVEKTHETEAGTEQISVSRYDKLKVSASFQCSSRWAGLFKEYSMQDVIVVSRYEALIDGYEDRNMRIRNYRQTLVEKSQYTTKTNGLWNVSFDLFEF